MKKIIIFIFILIGILISLFSVVDTTFAKKTKTSIEKGAHLNILMENEAFANEIKRLWNQEYPSHKDALDISVKPYEKKQEITYDIEWIKDRDIYKRKTLYKLGDINDEVTISVEEHLQRDKEYYMPIEGRGLLFSYNKKELHKLDDTIQKLTRFEQLKGLKHHMYYHNRLADYVYPFLFTTQHESIQEWIKDETFYENFISYRQLNKELSLYDDFINTDFYKNDSYICGLVSSDIDKNTPAYKQGDLKFTKIPSFQDKDFSPVVDTYGFVVRKDVSYPQAALAFLKLVRSEEGIQAWMKHTNKTILISNDDLEKVKIFDHTRKDMIEAMNASQLRNFSTEKIVNQSSIYSILQNSLYTKESDNAVWKKLIKEIEKQ